MAALDVLPLDKAKLYLNIPANVTKDDAELVEFIGAAVERVQRHLGGRELGPDRTAAELLACKMVLGEYWRTQRTSARGSFGGAGTAAAAVEADTGPAGFASLTARLTEILGDPVDSPQDVAVSGPQGSFPPAQSWPDPAVAPTSRWCR